tara:strand:+ start:918 stop:1349 length:432 start_codon:yes stop_codon:yes gene_type:complete
MSNTFSRLEISLAYYLNSNLSAVTVYAGDGGSFLTTPYVAIYSMSAAPLTTVEESYTDEIDVRVVIATDIDNDAADLASSLDSQVREKMADLVGSSWKDTSTNVVIHGMNLQSVERANRSQTRGIIQRWKIAASYLETAAADC